MLYVLTLQLLNSAGTTRCARCHQTLFLRSRVWGTRLTHTHVHTRTQEKFQTHGKLKCLLTNYAFQCYIHLNSATLTSNTLR